MENLAKLGIDGWSLVVYLVNFGLIWAVLGFLVFPKIIKIIDNRRDQIKDNLETADKLRLELDELVAKSRTERAKLLAELTEERDALKKDMDEKRSQILRDAEEQKEQMLTEARTLLKAERKKLVEDAQSAVIHIMQKTLVSMLSTKVPQEVIAESVEKSWEEHKAEVLQ